MKDFFKHIKTGLLGSSLISIVLGLFFILWPTQSARILCVIFGSAMVLYGVFQIISFIKNDDGNKGLKWFILALAIFLLIVGIWIITGPDIVNKLIVYFLGILILFHGIMDIVYSLQQKRILYNGWYITFIIGLVTAGSGILALINPFGAQKVLYIVLGVCFLFDGLSDIWVIGIMAYLKKKIRKAENNNTIIEVEAKEKLPAKTEH